MRILHSVAPGEFGGLEEVVIRLTAGLQERGHEVHVAVIVTDGSTEHSFITDIEASGVRAHPIGVTSRGYVSELSGVRRLAERFAPHVMHTHGYRPGVLHRWATRSLSVPLVTTLHGFTGGGLKNRAYEWAQLRSARRYDAVVAVSQSMLPRLRASGIPPERTLVIPNAWKARHALKTPAEARAGLGVPPDRFHVGWVGRLSREKGPDILLEACVHLGDLDATVSVVGDGRLRGELEAAASLIQDVDVRFHGSIQSAAAALPALDVFVLSSRTEGTPIALFEAMEAGVPVVAARVGGVPDVVDESTALLVPADSPIALADAIRAVYHRSEDARTRVRAARERLLDRFGIAPWVARHEELYGSLGAPSGSER